MKDQSTTTSQDFSIELFKELLDSCSSPMLICTDSGLLVYNNKASIELIGASYNSNKSLNIWDFDTVINDSESWQQQLQQIETKKTVSTSYFNKLTKETFAVDVNYRRKSISNNEVILIEVSKRYPQEEKEREINKLRDAHRRLLNTLNGVVYETDAKTFEIIYTSDIEKILGYTAWQWMNVENIWFNNIHPDDQDKIKDFLQNEILTTDRHSIEYRLYKSDGEVVWIRDNITVSYDDDHEPILYTGIMIDITDAKKVEEEYKNNKELLTHIYDSIPGAIFQYKIFPDGTDALDLVSKGAEELWEVPYEKILENIDLVWKKIHPDDLPGFVKSIDKSAKELSTWRYEWRFMMDDGRIKWIQALGQPRLTNDGVYIWHTVLFDITARKEVEEKLKRTLNLFNLCISIANLGIWELDLKTQALVWNDEMFDIYEIDKDSVEHNLDLFKNHVLPEDLQEIEQIISNVSQGDFYKEFRFRIKSGSGNLKHIYAAGAPVFNEKNEVTSITGINIDVSDITNYQEQLLSSLKEKDALFRELHHRVKNNLQMVCSMLFFKEAITKEENLKSFITETSNKIRSISEIHEQLLQLKEVDKLEIKSYLESLCKRVVSAYSTSNDHYSLMFDIESGYMNIDKALNIGLILNEAISNIIKYAYPETHEKPVYITYKPQGSYYLLEVKDEGVGISAEDKEKLGRSYGFQLLNIFSRQLKGTLEIVNDSGTAVQVKIPKD